MRCSPFLLVLTCLLISSLAQSAEVYVWTDENGKKHFGDRPPPKAASDVEKEQFELENVDKGYPITDPKLYESEAESYLARKQRERQEQAALRRQQRAAMKKPCREARQRLEMIQGRVNFHDDDGNPVYVTEQERRDEAEQLAADIRHYCH